MSRPRIAVLNGSLGGSRGNTGLVLARLVSWLSERAEVRVLELAREPAERELRDALEWSQAYVFATGTYWDSWGSPLQIFLESATELEAGSAWLGKPAAALVTMHSVGGKEVLSRLQGVLSTLGCVIPPMSGMAYSLSNHLALRGQECEHHADLWQLADLEVLGWNLLEALQPRPKWKPWPVDGADARRVWFSN